MGNRRPDRTNGEWAVLREDGGACRRAGRTHVLAGPRNKVGGSVSVQKAASSNVTGDYTLSSNASTNGKSP